MADFRVNDVLNGGQGAPLVPIYHYYLFAKQNKTLVILNIGGVSNITYFDNDLNSLIAFDLCFGNAPMNDLGTSPGRNVGCSGKRGSPASGGRYSNSPTARA